MTQSDALKKQVERLEGLASSSEKIVLEPAADPATIASVLERLHLSKLPDELDAFYLQHNGFRLIAGDSEWDHFLFLRVEELMTAAAYVDVAPEGFEYAFSDDELAEESTHIYRLDRVHVVDLGNGDSLACTVLPDGGPIWIDNPGPGPQTIIDRSLASILRRALDSIDPKTGEWQSGWQMNTERQQPQ